MTTYDIPLDKAEFLSVLLEALLYGFSLFMFGGAIWALSSQRSTVRVNYKMLAAACSLLLISTVHLVIDIIRVMDGFFWLQETSPGARIQFFSNVAHWTFVSKNYLYAVQTLIGDGVVLYRCYSVWQSKLIMVVPVLLWCAVAVTGFGCAFSESRVTQGGIFIGSLSRWIISFWVSTLTTNAVATFLLAYRIWYIDRKTAKLSEHCRKSELRPVLYVIIDAGGIYSITLFAALVCFINKSNGQYVILDMIMPIISITFYMVIIRVGLANRASQPMHSQSFGPTSSVHSLTRDRSSKVDSCRHPSMSPMRPMSFDGKRRSEIKFDNIEEEV